MLCAAAAEDAGVTDREIVTASLRLLRPYRIPDTCPYLSDNQRELSLLSLEQRSAWMGEWLMLAQLNEPNPAPLVARACAAKDAKESRPAQEHYTCEHSYPNS